MTTTTSAPTLTPDRLLTTHEAARVLGYADGTMRNHRAAGTGPRYVKLGRSIRYRESDLQEFIAGLK